MIWLEQLEWMQKQFLQFKRRWTHSNKVKNTLVTITQWPPDIQCTCNYMPHKNTGVFITLIVCWAQKKRKNITLHPVQFSNEFPITLPRTTSIDYTENLQYILQVSKIHAWLTNFKIKQKHFGQGDYQFCFLKHSEIQQCEQTMTKPFLNYKTVSPYHDLIHCKRCVKTLYVQNRMFIVVKMTRTDS